MMGHTLRRSCLEICATRTITMNESTIDMELERYFTAAATLAAIGVKVRQLELFEPIR